MKHTIVAYTAEYDDQMLPLIVVSEGDRVLMDEQPDGRELDGFKRRMADSLGHCAWLEFDGMDEDDDGETREAYFVRLGQEEQ